MFQHLKLAFIPLILLVLIAPAVHAQVTTGTLAGTVRTQSDEALPGVTIEALHVPTGTRYSTVSGSNGRYVIPNVRVGGPYTVTAMLEGFQPREVTGINVRLGGTAEVPIVMRLTALAETITVAADVPLVDRSRAGSTSAVSEEQIESLPTVNRSIQDFARTNPYFTVDPSDDTGTRMSVAGRNNRYNSIQIDGAVNNDLFGLAATGTPGGQTDAQPISLDAIQQLQLVVSPYDVRQSGFTGGGINAVTRSGTNDLAGSLFWSPRSESLIGDGPFDRPIANFDHDQYGGRFGGPIVRDRLFFFGSGEVNRREEPTGVSADDTTGTVFRDADQAARLREFLIENYQYDPGTLGDFPGETNSDLLFARFDWNVDASNQLTLRHNFVDALRDVVSNRSSSTFRFPTAIYTIADETNSTVAQLNSVISANAFNEARIGFQTIRDSRQTPVTFPTVEIGGTGPRRGSLHVGTERFSGANELDQDILEITNDLTLVRGNHTLTIGTNNELFEFRNLFLSDFFGYYYFPTLEAFEAGTPAEYRISFATGDDPRRATEFEANRFGVYVSDQWQASDRLTVTGGIRADMPDFSTTPSDNPIVRNAIGFSTAETPSEDVVVSPRVGFTWDPTGSGQQQLRGGVGIFLGRTPYVWISNAYANTGVESAALSCIAPRCTPPQFDPDPLSQPRDLGQGGSLSVDLIDPDFEFPRVMRVTLGYDRELFGGIRGSVEGILTQTQEDVFYYNVNRVETGTSPLDGRPTYSFVSDDLRDAILLSNTSKGDDLMASVQLMRPFSRGLTVSAAYTYQDAESAFDATSSRAISNWQFFPTRGDIFSEDVARSAFMNEHRFSTAISYDFSTGPLHHGVGLYYNAQSGRPYSLLMSGDPNQDGYRSNDLLYIPGSADEVILQDSRRNVISYSVLENFLQSAGVDPTAGRIMSRNELDQPWTRQLDFHYEIGLPVRGVRTMITADVVNLLNLIDSDEGVFEYVRFGTYTPISYAGQDEETGKPIYRESFTGALEPGRQFSTQDLRSRWQARIGIRLTL